MEGCGCKGWSRLDADGLISRTGRATTSPGSGDGEAGGVDLLVR